MELLAKGSSADESAIDSDLVDETRAPGLPVAARSGCVVDVDGFAHSQSSPTVGLLID